MNRPTGFVLACTGLLVIDFLVGGIAFGRCIDAGDACSNTNAWLDEVTVIVAAVLIALIVCGTLAAVIIEIREKRRLHVP